MRSRRQFLSLFSSRPLASQAIKLRFLVRALSLGWIVLAGISLYEAQAEGSVSEWVDAHNSERSEVGENGAKP